MLRRTLDRALRTSSSYGATTSAGTSYASLSAATFTRTLFSGEGGGPATARGNALNSIATRFASSFFSFASKPPSTTVARSSIGPTTLTTTTTTTMTARSYATSQKVKMSKTSTKIKGYSSWKGRFSVTASGLFRRKQKGKRHMGFSKTPKQRRQLRGTKLVDKTLERPMRKLGFSMV